MPISTEDQTIVLTGHCSVEEVETFYEAARALHEPVFDVSGATYLHTSVVQVIMASNGTVRGQSGDLILAACLRGRTAP